MLNGEEFPPNTYPWLAFIINDQGSSCTASVISKKAVLTAAHCVCKCFFFHDKTSIKDQNPAPNCL